MLERAISAYAFKCHNLDIDTSSIDIIVKEKPIKKKCLQRIQKFLKHYLSLISFLGKGEVGYGMSYRIAKNTLQFYGAPNDYIKNKTLVVQIINKRGRILKEIWIKGIKRKNEEKTLTDQAL